MAAGVGQTEKDGVEWLRVEVVSDNSECPCARCHPGTPLCLSGAFPSIHPPGEWQAAPPLPRLEAPPRQDCTWWCSLSLPPAGTPGADFIEELLRKLGQTGGVPAAQEGERELCGYWANHFPFTRLISGTVIVWSLLSSWSKPGLL